MQHKSFVMQRLQQEHLKTVCNGLPEPSMEATTALMNHEGIATILATGGNAMVKAAYSCGNQLLELVRKRSSLC